MRIVRKLRKNENGFTLVEILVVIAIIAILFVTLLPQIDNAVNRSRETGVKTDFRAFQASAESYMKEVAGRKLKDEHFSHNYLDEGSAIRSDTNNTGFGLDSKKTDPWGIRYDTFIYQKDKAIVFQSFGPDEKRNTIDDYFLATYYDKGYVFSCTHGFDSNNIDHTLIDKENCGVKKADGTDFDLTATHNPITW